MDREWDLDHFLHLRSRSCCSPQSCKSMSLTQCCFGSSWRKLERQDYCPGSYYSAELCRSCAILLACLLDKSAASLCWGLELGMATVLSDQRRQESPYGHTGKRLFL